MKKASKIDKYPLSLRLTFADDHKELYTELKKLAGISGVRSTDIVRIALAQFMREGKKNGYKFSME